MKKEYLIFHLDGSVDIGEHEGTKNIWPVGTIFARLWDTSKIRGAYSAPQLKINTAGIVTVSYACITPEHRAFLFLLEVEQPPYPYDPNAINNYSRH